LKCNVSRLDRADGHGRARIAAMRYFFAIVLPPLAVLSCGKPVQADRFVTAPGRYA
jgi:hypothetical protein